MNSKNKIIAPTHSAYSLKALLKNLPNNNDRVTNIKVVTPIIAPAINIEKESSIASTTPIAKASILVATPCMISVLKVKGFSGLVVLIEQISTSFSLWNSIISLIFSIKIFKDSTKNIPAEINLEIGPILSAKIEPKK